MSHMPSEYHKVVFRDYDPAASDTWANVQSTQYLDMSGWNKLMVIAFRTVGTGNAGIRLAAATAAAGTGTTVIKTVGTTSCTGLLASASKGPITSPGCGMLVIECSYSEVAKALAGGRFVTAQMIAATGTDEFGVAYIFTEPRVAEADQTVTGTSV